MGGHPHEKNIDQNPRASDGKRYAQGNGDHGFDPGDQIDAIVSHNLIINLPYIDS